MRRTLVLAPDGQRLVVIRPSSPALQEKALALAEAALRENSREIFQTLPGEVGDYIFMGFLAKHPRSGALCVADMSGNKTGDLEPGDSFVGERDVERAEPSPPTN